MPRFGLEHSLRADYAGARRAGGRTLRRSRERVRLEGYAAAAFTKLSFQREFTEKKTHARLSGLLAAMPEAERAARFAEGAALSPEAAIDAALEALSES